MEDNSKKWAGLDFAGSTRAAQDRTRWKGIVVKSLVAPPTTSQGYGIDQTGETKIDRPPTE